MPDPKNFDMDFRPISYWNDDDYFSVATKFKGELRRQVAIQREKEQIYDPVICAENLSDEQRLAAGMVHPMFMGGEYLPNYLRHDEEIARVTLKSVTMDVISIRARRLKHRIAYRIVDEYEDEGLFEYHLIQKTSIRPLTMRRLIEMIDKAQEYGGLSGNARHCSYDGNAEELYDFATITSEFYPELQEWYDQANQDWLDVELEKITGMTKEERLEEEYHKRYLDGQPARNKIEEGWRERNKEALEAELREHQDWQLRILWEKRYRAGDAVQSEDEISWRAENGQRIDLEMEFQSKVSKCMSAYKYVDGTCAMGGAHGAAIRRYEIKKYVESYLGCHGVPPTGQHHIKTKIGSNSCPVTIRVTFQQ